PAAAVVGRMLAVVRAGAAHPRDLARLLAGPAGRERYLELLRAPALSLGLYRLPAGSRDEQQPHGEDEVYYTLSGRGRLQVGEAEHAVEPGTLHFVAARAEHRFHSITEDLALLVFSAPAERTAWRRRTGPPAARGCPPSIRGALSSPGCRSAFCCGPRPPWSASRRGSWPWGASSC